MTAAEESRMTLILGVVGMGKSTLASALMSKHKKTLIIDPRAEHPGDVVCNSVHEFLEMFPKVQDQKKLRVVCRHKGDDGDYKNYLFMFLASDHQPADGWAVMVDEVDEYCSPRHILPEFRRFINYRRHWRISEIVCVARRAAAIHMDCSSLADRLSVFHLHGRTDLDYVRFSCGDQFANMLPKLGKKQYLTKNLVPV